MTKTNGQNDKHQSLANSPATVNVKGGNWYRKFMAFAGPAYLVSVGYMDPGNWATDIEGGARFGYSLIWVLLMSNLMAVLLQTLSARLGIVTGYDLAQGCRREYPKPVNFILWILAEIAIAATDLAEAIGTIIGLNLLFGMPLMWGLVVTAFDTFLLLAIQRLGVRKMEAFILSLIGVIGVSFFIQVFLASPDWGSLFTGFIPSMHPEALYIAIGIIGATVMPHNLYLHSSLVQSRVVSNTYTGKNEACRFNLFDSIVALNAAFLVNAAILVMAAADFFSRGLVVTEIQQAYHLLEPLLGTQIAPIAFALALLAAGQSSTLTGTISGQIVMEGYLNIRMRPWLRRMLTRSVALAPAIVVIALMGNEGTYQLLILSQVILSLQLPFAVIPLIHFTSDPHKMGAFANKLWVKILAWIVAAIIVALNLMLAYGEVSSWLSGGPWWLVAGAIAAIAVAVVILAYITFAPIFGRKTTWETSLISSSATIAEKIRKVEFRNIGVALEHAAGDADTISVALSQARSHKAKLTLVHVVETPTTIVYEEGHDSLHSREDQEYLEGLVREVEEHDLPVEYLLLTGNPIEQIVKSVEDMQFDLLVLGSHGHVGLEDVFFGQTVSKVRHAIDIPVMVVRSTSRETERAQRTV